MIKLSEILTNTSWINVTNVIYKITNLVNGKIYIGQTSISLRKRLLKHLSDAKPNTKVRKHYLQRAILKHGPSNFVVEILETCDKNSLDEREIYWINHYNSIDSQLGYNCTHGGQGNRSILVSEDTRKLISESNKNKWKDPEYRKLQETNRAISIENRKIKIVQLDLSYNYIKTWNSKKEVCEQFSSLVYNLKDDRTVIRMGENLFMTETEYSKLELGDPVIVQLDDNYNLINKYYSYTDANAKILLLCGCNGRLQFTATQPRTSKKGTKKAGYIWMTYENYIKLSIMSEIKSK